MKNIGINPQELDFTIKSCDEELFRFLTADLRAAVWIAKVPKLTDEALFHSFIEFHKYLMFISTGNKKKLFKDVSKDRLILIIRKWADLYYASLTALRKYYPRTQQSADLQLGTTNWSKVLDLSAEGVAKIPHAFRYAESWAERSIHCEEIFETFYERVEFTKSESFKFLNDLFDNDNLAVFDRRLNAVPSFDLIKDVKANNISSILHFYSSKGWLVKRLEITAAKAVLSIAREYNSGD